MKVLYNFIIHAKYLNHWIIFFTDLFLSIFSTLIVIMFICYIDNVDYKTITIIRLLLVSFSCSVISFLCCQPFKGIIRHSSFAETGRIAMSASLKTAILIPLIIVLRVELTFRDILLVGVVDFFLTFFLLIILRALVIIIYGLLVRNAVNDHDKLFIFESESSGTSLIQFTLSDKSQFRIEGYLRIGEKTSLRMGKYQIYSIADQADFNRLVNRKGIKGVLFPNHRIVKEESERLVRYCEKKKVRMMVLPPVDEVRGGKITLFNLPEVRIEDLLSREEIKINMQQIGTFLEGKTILVSGAAGSIGSETCRQLARFKIKKLICFDSAETPMHDLRLELEDKYPALNFVPVIGDVRSVDRVDYVFRNWRPQVVYHAAAYKHVPLMEENPCEAVRVNVYGTRLMADAAVKYNVEKFVMVSTDKAVNPTNIMGCSKRLAEIYIQSLNLAIARKGISGQTKFITTRFGNVLGSNGSVIPRFRDQIKNGGPVTVTHPDIIRYFMTIPEACRLILEAGTMGDGGEIYIFDMGQPVKIIDLAKRMIELSGLEQDKDIEIKFTGLRPGEKLYEELLSDEENTKPTLHEKIRVASVREYDYSTALGQVESLAEYAKEVDILAMVKDMKRFVPEFKSKNSGFEELDK